MPEIKAIQFRGYVTEPIPDKVDIDLNPELWICPLSHQYKLTLFLENGDEVDCQNGNITEWRHKKCCEQLSIDNIEIVETKDEVLAE